MELLIFLVFIYIDITWPQHCTYYYVLLYIILTRRKYMSSFNVSKNNTNNNCNALRVDSLTLRQYNTMRLNSRTLALVELKKVPFCFAHCSSTECYYFTLLFVPFTSAYKNCENIKLNRVKQRRDTISYLKSCYAKLSEHIFLKQRSLKFRTYRI